MVMMVIDPGDRSHWPMLEHANTCELLAYLGTSPLAESQIGAELAWVITGVADNTYNGVISAHLPNGKVDSTLDAMLAHFTGRNLPALWLVADRDRPDDLRARLAQRGCRQLSPGVCMVADLQATKRDFPAVDGLTVMRVANEADLDAWLRVWALDNEDDTVEVRQRLYVSLGLGTDRPLWHYVAWLEGEPVGIAQVFFGRQAASLLNVRTLPSLRRRGIGSALALHAMEHAHAHGFRVIALAPSPDGVPLYRQLGFELLPAAGDAFVLPT